MMQIPVFLKINIIIAGLILGLFSVSSYADNGVLQSSGPKEEDAQSSSIVPAVDTISSTVSSEGQKTGPAPTIKMTFKSKSKPKSNVTPSTAQSNDAPLPSVQQSSSSGDADGLGIYYSKNPLLTTPQGSSPFVKRVGTEAPEYKRSAVLSPGNITSSPASKATLTSRPKNASAQSSGS